MASKAHNIIAAIIVRSMRDQGFEPISADVQEVLFGNYSLPTSRVIGMHRPDLIGFRKSDHRVCIGEAKTKSDILSLRTKEELRDFSSYKEIDLFIGVPSDGVHDLEHILKILDLQNHQNIKKIVVPKELLS